MPSRHPCYRRPSFQRLFDDAALLFDRSPPSRFSLGCLIKDGLLRCVHLSLVDTYRCAHNGQHPYLLSLRPDGLDQSLTLVSMTSSFFNFVAASVTLARRMPSISAINPCVSGNSSDCTRSRTSSSQRAKRWSVSWRRLHATFCEIWATKACVYLSMTSRISVLRSNSAVIEFAS